METRVEKYFIYLKLNKKARETGTDSGRSWQPIKKGDHKSDPPSMLSGKDMVKRLLLHWKQFRGRHGLPQSVSSAPAVFQGLPCT